MTITENLKIDIDFSGFEIEGSDPQTTNADTVTLGNFTITGGKDNEINLTENAAGKNVLSGFYLAQWFATAYWRLCYEIFTPERSTVHEDYPESDFYIDHNIASIGYGYVWPDITITTNGNIVTLKSSAFEHPYEKDDGTDIQYTSNDSISVPLQVFQKAVLGFINKVNDYIKKSAPHIISSDAEYKIFEESLERLPSVHYTKDGSDTQKKYRIMGVLGLYDCDDKFLSYMVRQPKRNDGLKFSFEQQGLVIRNCGIPDTYFVMRSITQIRKPVLEKALVILKKRFGDGSFDNLDKFFYMERVSKNGNSGDIFKDCSLDVCEKLTSFLYDVSSATDTFVMIDNMIDVELRSIEK